MTFGKYISRTSKNLRTSNAQLILEKNKSSESGASDYVSSEGENKFAHIEKIEKVTDPDDEDANIFSNFVKVTCLDTDKSPS